MLRTSNILVAILSAGLLLGSDPDLRPQPVAPPAPALSDFDSDAGFTVSPPFESAAKALRESDFDAVENTLEPLTAGAGETALDAHLILGLAAHASERVERAERELRAAADPGGPLEDWRLFILADCEAALDRPSLALSALSELVAQHATSPLLSRALLRGAEIAWDAGRVSATQAWISRAHALGIDSKLRPKLNGLEWRAAEKSGQIERTRRTARRLLIEAPLLASRLGVAETFRRPDGTVPWNEILTPAETIERASNLLRAGLESAALETLKQVPMPARDTDWRIEMARALTEDHRGKDALELLSPSKVGSINGALGARVNWQRAKAALEAAAVRRHRRNLPLAKRQALRRDARHDFIRVAAYSDDPTLTARALRHLFADLAEEGEFERSLNVLRRLRRLDPTDTTGEENLWERGWQAFENGNSSGAIGYWSELEDIYPNSRRSRGAHYWSACAYQRLGDNDQATAIFSQIAAASTNDFYRRHALERLARTSTKPLAIPSHETRQAL
ncbi:MAG TPA: tetratricopeptide repeat protein, partial [Thermoanaerobaculia bacterium]|nr:tetratricopeptide repeat protein [Thermoanaerobaculia bacterium]